MITCREVADFLMQYLDHELPPIQRQEFERHLGACGPCVHYLDSYRQTIALGKQAFADDAASIPEELVQAILAARAKKQA